MSTYNDASLIYYPSGYKAGTAYSLKPTDGSGDLTFTRASTATRVNESGLIESVAANVPRLDNSQGGCSSLLLEPQRTNLLPHSRGFNSWLIPPSVTTNSTTSKYGDSVFSYYGATTKTNINIASNVDYTFSVLAKKSNWDFIVIRTSDYDATANARTWFNLTTGTVGSTNPIGYHYNTKIEDWGDGWYLCSFSFKTVTDLIGSYSISGAATDGSITVGTTNIEDIFYDAAQVEQGSYSTSRINTSGTAVTRVADSASKSGISSLINSEEGSFYVEAKALFNGGTFRSFSLTDGTEPNRITFNWSSNASVFLLFVKLGGTLIVNNSTSAFAQTDNNKILLKWGGGTYKLFINGVLKTTLTGLAMPSASLFNRLTFDASYTPFEGRVQGVMIFPTQVSDTDAIALTTL